jgi:hypothetical protein
MHGTLTFLDQFCLGHRPSCLLAYAQLTGLSSVLDGYSVVKVRFGVLMVVRVLSNTIS